VLPLTPQAIVLELFVLLAVGPASGSRRVREVQEHALSGLAEVVDLLARRAEPRPERADQDVRVARTLRSDVSDADGTSQGMGRSDAGPADCVAFQAWIASRTACRSLSVSPAEATTTV
jgi:hypothetical protein